MGQTSERLDLNGRGAFLSASLPSPSSLRDATSPKVRGLGSPQSFRFHTLRPAAARRAVRRCAETFRLCQGLPLWGSWREAPERASPAEGTLRLCFALRTVRQRGQGCLLTVGKRRPDSPIPFLLQIWYTCPEIETLQERIYESNHRHPQHQRQGLAEGLH